MMPPIQIWQVAAGLGVGAFLAAIFYGIVLRFGRKKGDGFETSKLGPQATSAIAVLIVVLGAVITLVGLVLYAPGNSRPDSQLNRTEQLTAINEYVEGTSGVFNELDAYTKWYTSEFQKLRESGKSPEDINKQLVGDLYTRLRASANIATSYSALESAFPQFTLDARGWKDIREHNRELYSEFCDAVYKAHTAGLAPDEDKATSIAFAKYIEYRKQITDACRKTVIP